MPSYDKDGMNMQRSTVLSARLIADAEFNTIGRDPAANQRPLTLEAKTIGGTPCLTSIPSAMLPAFSGCQLAK